MASRRPEGPGALEHLADVTSPAPSSWETRALGTQARPNSAWPAATTCWGTMSTAPGQDGHVEALVLVEALSTRSEVTGELRLGHPLQLQLD